MEKNPTSTLEIGGISNSAAVIGIFFESWVFFKTRMGNDHFFWNFGFLCYTFWAGKCSFFGRNITFFEIFLKVPSKTNKKKNTNKKKKKKKKNKMKKRKTEKQKKIKKKI